MQSIIWAFGSMLVLMLFITFLPLGYTIKGKITIVLASFVLSLGGIAAVSSFSLLLTALLLIILVFFTTYMLEQRAASLLYKGNTLFEDEIDESNVDESFLDSKFEKMKEDHILKLTELEKVESTGLNRVDESINEMVPTTVMSEIVPVVDEDISLLQEREPYHEDVIHHVDLENEEDYFSDIESLIVEEIDEHPINIEEFPLDENGNLSIIDEGKIEYLDSDELEPLNEFPLDFLLAEMEAAAENDEIKDEKNKEKILQK